MPNWHHHSRTLWLPLAQVFHEGRIVSKRIRRWKCWWFGWDYNCLSAGHTEDQAAGVSTQVWFVTSCIYCDDICSGSMSVVFTDMRKQDGFKSLYRGMLSPAVGFGLTFAGRQNPLAYKL